MRSKDLHNFNGKDWRSVDRNRDFWVSEDGYIYNHRLDNVLTPYKERSGYLTVNIGKKVSIADLVCTAFHGPRPKGYTVEHIDKNRINNYAINLAWRTQKQNNNNRSHNGTRATPLDKTQWRLLIEQYLTGFYSQYQLTDWANIKFNRNSATMVYNGILNGKSYKPWYSQLTQAEREKIKKITDSRKCYYR